MRKDSWPVTKSYGCMFCGRLFGEQHALGCAFREKTIIGKFILTLIDSVPEDWTESEMNFHKQGSSWCGDNLMEMLEEHLKRTGECLCPHLDYEFVREATEEDEKDYKFSIQDVKS